MTNQTNQTATAPTTAEKINEAASAIGSSWDGSECVYFDDSTRKNYRCEDEDEMIDLYDLLHSDDDDVRRDAYSHWCSQTSHEETAEINLGSRVEMTAENSNWTISEKGTVVWLGGDRAAIAFDGREDDYTAFLSDFKTI